MRTNGTESTGQGFGIAEGSNGGRCERLDQGFPLERRGNGGRGRRRDILCSAPTPCTERECACVCSLSCGPMYVVILRRHPAVLCRGQSSDEMYAMETHVGERARVTAVWRRLAREEREEMGERATWCRTRKRRAEGASRSPSWSTRTRTEREAPSCPQAGAFRRSPYVPSGASRTSLGSTLFRPSALLDLENDGFENLRA